MATIPELIVLLCGKYSLPPTAVRREIEAVFSAHLSAWYRLPVIAFVRADCTVEALVYDHCGGAVRQRVLETDEILRAKGNLRRRLEAGLARATVAVQVQCYKEWEKSLAWGEIVGRDPEGNLSVEVELIPGERLTALCPHHRLGLHERDSGYLARGQRRAFHLRRVELVYLQDTPRLQIVLDRVSKNLVAHLLRAQPGVGSAQLHCVHRCVGYRSLVLASRRLPQAAIRAVDRELQERVQVRFSKNSWSGS